MTFSGKWRFARHEGLKDILDLFNVAQERRDPAKLQGATVEIQQDGDNFTITTTGGLGNSGTANFTVGGQQSGELFGKPFSGDVSWDGGALVMKGERGTVRREVIGGELVYTLDAGGKTAKLFLTK